MFSVISGGAHSYIKKFYDHCIVHNFLIDSNVVFNFNDKMNYVQAFNKETVYRYSSRLNAFITIRWIRSRNTLIMTG